MNYTDTHDTILEDPVNSDKKPTYQTDDQRKANSPIQMTSEYENKVGGPNYQSLEQSKDGQFILKSKTVVKKPAESLNIEAGKVRTFNTL
jgi:hypothetical protein